jgi:hypothetical protein
VGGEQLGEVGRVVVAVDVRLGPREAAAVDEAGMVLGVGEDRVAAVG